MRLQGGMKRREMLSLVAALPILGVASCSSSAGAKPSLSEHSTTIYVVGDSLTAGDSPDFTNRRFGERSWVFHLDSRISVMGGWAEGGARTEDMAREVTPSDAETLVLLAGANDTSSVPFETTAHNLDRVVGTVDAQRVAVSLLPPRDIQSELNVEFNTLLSASAKERGWYLIDPMKGLRDGAKFKAGMTSDGIHPTVAGAREIGRAMSDLLLALP